MRVEFAASAPEARDSSDVLPVRKPAPRRASPDPPSNEQARSDSPPRQEKVQLPEPPQRSLSIRVDENKQIVYRIIDERTGEVVRQIPPEEVRRASRNIAELVRSSEARAKHQIDIDT